MVEIPTNNAATVTRFCLVRHGETEWNAERRLQGQIDIALNATGLRQAAAAGRWLARESIDAIYSSDLQRAWATAGAIAQACGRPVTAAPEMRERNYGLFQGMTYDEARRAHPELYARFEQRDPDYAFETGESLDAMYARVTGRLQALAEAHPGQTVVVVLHGGVLDVINRFIRGQGLTVPRDFLIPNAGLNWVSCCAGAWGIDAWADTAHLENGALDELPS